MTAVLAPAIRAVAEWADEQRNVIVLRAGSDSKVDAHTREKRVALTPLEVAANLERQPISAFAKRSTGVEQVAESAVAVRFADGNRRSLSVVVDSLEHDANTSGWYSERRVE